MTHSSRKRTHSQMQSDSNMGNNNSNSRRSSVERKAKKAKLNDTDRNQPPQSNATEQPHNNDNTTTAEDEKMGMDIDDTETEHKNNENESINKPRRSVSYPMPMPQQRRSVSSNRVFDPMEYVAATAATATEAKLDDDDTCMADGSNDADRTNSIDVDETVSSLPPLIASPSQRDSNEHELYGWGCVDPLLYAAKPDCDNNEDDENDAAHDGDDDDDEVLRPQCLIARDNLKFDFNELDAHFGSAVLYQRDANGLYGWGDNEDGSIGDTADEQLRQPTLMRSFVDRPVRCVSVGEKHSAVILQYGGLYVFGCNESGQCGWKSDEHFRVKPTEVVPGLRDAHFCQVACGSVMTLALTQHGTLYSFGSKDVEGLLGRSNFVRWPSFQASAIPTMYFYPVVEIAVGERHCVVRTRYNRMFAWGRNHHGQLGLGDTKTRTEPTEIRSLIGVEMVQVDCGAAHTALLGKNGQLLCFGGNNHGQCGVDPNESAQILRPHTVASDAFCENSLTQIACGQFHTLCTDSLKVWAFGQNLQGQCTGDANDGNKLWAPVQVDLRHGDPGGDDDDQNSIRMITRLCGTHFSSLVLSKRVDADYVTKCQTLQKLQPVHFPYCIDFTQLDILCAEIENNQTDISYLSSLLTTIFGSPSCLNQSFLANANVYRFQLGTGVDFERLQKAYARILGISPMLTNRLVKSLLTLARRSLKYAEHVQEACNLRFYFLILSYPDIVNPGFNHSIFQQLNELLRRVAQSKPHIFEQLTVWVSSMPLSTRMTLLSTLQECMSMFLEIKSKADLYVAYLCTPMKLLHDANERVESDAQRIPFGKFYNRTLTRNGYLDFGTDYVQFAHPNHRGFSFCDFPFLLDPVAKRNILRIEKRAMQQLAARPNLQQLFAAGNMGFNHPIIFNPYLVIGVRRAHVLQDTLNVITRVAQTNAGEFRKELKVVFDKEEGVDQGGVRKEFFQLIIRECFDVKYGTFVFNDETRTYWFNQNALENPEEFGLLGIVIGLAIYNGVLLDISFPPVIYKKMCGKQLSLADLHTFDPRIHASLGQVAEYDGDVSDLCLTFSRDYMKWDKLETVDLIENGRETPVTNENKLRYIDVLAKYYLTDSVKSQFDAFLKGFKMVLEGKAFDLIQRGEELELLVVGNQTLDFDALEVSCKYEGGYNADHKVMRWFWEIIHMFDDQQKKQFLKFFSGSDRAPLRGLGKLGMLIQKATGDHYTGHQLPTAHTCFNALLLPAYATKELTREKLLAAIQYSEGFGLK